MKDKAGQIIWWLMITFSGLFFTAAAFEFGNVESEIVALRGHVNESTPRLAILEANQATLIKRLDSLDSKMDRMIDIQMRRQ